MAFFSHALLRDTALTHGAARKPSLLSRFFAALIESRRRQADREIARYIHLNGSMLTDSVEREIGQRLLPGSGRF
jgi:hypothetical protein